MSFGNSSHFKKKLLLSTFVDTKRIIHMQTLKIQFELVVIFSTPDDDLISTLGSISLQKYKNFQITLVGIGDTKSVDRIVDQSKLAKAVRSTTLNQDNGIFDAMNIALAQIRDESLKADRYVFFINSGVEFFSSMTLSIVAEILAIEDCPDILACQTIQKFEENRYVRPSRFTSNLADYSHHSVFVKVADSIPFYDTSLQLSADRKWLKQLDQDPQNQKQFSNIIVTLADLHGLSSQLSLHSLLFKVREKGLAILPTVLFECFLVSLLPPKYVWALKSWISRYKRYE